MKSRDYKENEVVTISLERYEKLNDDIKVYKNMMIDLCNCNEFNENKDTLTIKKDELLNVLWNCHTEITHEWFIQSPYKNKDLTVEVV